MALKTLGWMGACATDGSTLNGLWRPAIRSGWAAAQVRPDGSLVKAIYGELPLPRHSNLAAELWGFLQLLRHALAPEVVGVDNSQLFQGLLRGPVYCQASGRPFANIWRQIWHKLQDLGLDVGSHEGAGLRVVKVKSHTKQAARAKLSQPELLMVKANAHADHWAKRGAKRRGDLDWQGAHYLAEAKQVKRVAQYLASFRVALGGMRTTSLPPPRPVSARRRLALARASRAGRQAKDTLIQRLWGREVCARSSALPSGRLVLPPSATLGHAMASLAHFVFCTRCGAFASKRGKHLREDCPEAPRNIKARISLARLLAGQHPETKAPLGEVQLLASQSEATGGV